MAISLNQLPAGARINLSTNAPVGNVARFANYVYQGKVGYAIAKDLDDVQAIVSQTKSYFRPGTPTDQAAIEYVLLKETEASRIVVLPEPLVQLSTVTLVSDVVYTAVISDDISMEDLSAILVGAGLKQFTLTNNQS